MKALILAAGSGTRLLPYTRKIPKPLFTLLSKPMLELTIEKLVAAGCEQIFINTHHLHEQIESFVKKNQYTDDIQLLYEPVILDTGGAIANAKPFLTGPPFFVINADIISSIDLKEMYEFHEKSNCLATLALFDHDKFNKVSINEQGYIQNFNSKSKGLTFTGIQVLSPKIYDYFPDKNIFSSITVYQTLCAENQVKAFIKKDIFWSDMGTKTSYSRTSWLTLAASTFGISAEKIKDIHVVPLAGDGSDRQWYRAIYKDQSRIISDHGICMPDSSERSQVNAFIHIGNHLFDKDIPLPRIITHDTLSGIVVLDDLGDDLLETVIKHKNNDATTLKLYKKTIDLLIDFSIRGIQGFKKEWTCQTETYSKELIIERECRYFLEAFLQNYLKKDVCFHEFSDEFEHIADHALLNGFHGLMHRDMQSRNIMIKNHQLYVIDFQGARPGPLQYDLASLLIDPYVMLNEKIKKDLLDYAMKKLDLDKDRRQKFTTCYQYCCLTRNLQFLGAFSFLSQIKNKKNFEIYIPDAVTTLKKVISGLNTDKLPRLSNLVQTL